MMSGAVWLTSLGAGKGFSGPCDQAGRGVDEEVPVVTISKQPSVMLL